MKDIKNKTALITGASSGIGLEFTKIFAKDGYDLVLVARRLDLLESLAKELKEQYNISVIHIAKDLSDIQQAHDVVQHIDEQKITIDVLVNNAGFGTFGFFKDIEWEKEHAMMELNMIMLTYLTKIYLKKMIANEKGNILNVASTAAFQPGPLMAVYFATKAYVLSLSEALANECAGTGVSITALCPGPTVTGFQKAAVMGDSALFSHSHLPTAHEVALLGYKGMHKGKTVIIPRVKNKLFVQLLRIAPRYLVTRVVRNLNQ